MELVLYCLIVMMAKIKQNMDLKEIVMKYLKINAVIIPILQIVLTAHNLNAILRIRNVKILHRVHNYKELPIAKIIKFVKQQNVNNIQNRVSANL